MAREPDKSARDSKQKTDFDDGAKGTAKRSTTDAESQASGNGGTEKSADKLSKQTLAEFQD